MGYDEEARLRTRFENLLQRCQPWITVEGVAHIADLHQGGEFEMEYEILGLELIEADARLPSDLARELREVGRELKLNETDDFVYDVHFWDKLSAYVSRLIAE